MNETKRVKIIYAEDSKSISHLVISKLSLENFNVIHFENGNGVFEAVLNEKPDIVILDHNMPIKNGVTVLEELKSSDLTKNIPVIIFTTKQDNTTVEKCIKLGITDYIVKDSLAISNLIPRIKKHLKR